MHRKFLQRLWNVEHYEPYPDYPNQETTNRISTNNGTWTVDRDGYINVYGQAASNAGSGTSLSLTLTIDDAPILLANTWTTASMGITAKRTEKVHKGQTIKITGVGTTVNSISCYFVPIRWVLREQPFGGGYSLKGCLDAIGGRWSYV